MSSKGFNFGDISKDFGRITNKSGIPVIVVLKLPITSIILTVDLAPGESKESPGKAFANVYEQGKYSGDELISMQNSSVSATALGIREHWEVQRVDGRLRLKKV